MKKMICGLLLSAAIPSLALAKCNYDTNKIRKFMNALSHEDGFEGMTHRKWKTVRGTIKKESYEDGFYLEAEGNGNSWYREGCDCDGDVCESWAISYEIENGCFIVNGDVADVSKVSSTELAFTEKYEAYKFAHNFKLSGRKLEVLENSYKNGKWKETNHFKGSR